MAAILAEEHPELEWAAIAVDSCGRESGRWGQRSGWRSAASWRAGSRRWWPRTSGTWTARSARVNALFWAHLDDRDIGALSRRIVVSIPPERLLTWQPQVLLPASSAPEIAAAAARQPSPI